MARRYMSIEPVAMARMRVIAGDAEESSAEDTSEREAVAALAGSR